MSDPRTESLLQSHIDSIDRFTYALGGPDGEYVPGTTISAYWHDPASRARMDAEIEAQRARCHAALDASIARARIAQAERLREIAESERPLLNSIPMGGLS